MKNLRLVFAGTPEFTLPSLQALADSSHDLVAVYTQPDRPAGRGRKLKPSVVKSWALDQGLPVFQPQNFKQEEAIQELAGLTPDLLVVIAYGLILPPKVLSLPRLGCINVHASLLPRWRGASPIQQALLHGDAETGVTIMQMDAGLDTGDKLLEANCPITAQDTASSLHDKLAQLAVAPLLETLDLLAKGQINPIPQDSELATFAGKIKKEQAAIDWTQSAFHLDRQIRAFNPWPIAYTTAGEEVLRLHQATPQSQGGGAKPGTVLTLDKRGMAVATGHGQILMVETIQFPGGKAMSVADWLNSGRTQLHEGLVLG